MRRCPSLVLLTVQSILLVVGNAEVTPHATRVDRLVDSRGEFTVEYSPGQEGWVELTFERLAVKQASAANAEPPPAPKLPPLAFAKIEENREALLESIAHQIGLTAPTDLQRRTFDTFLGYYELLTQGSQQIAPRADEHLRTKHLAIWHREELTDRLRQGEVITGFEYDPVTDQGAYRLNTNFMGDSTTDRVAEIRKAIFAQQIDHSFDYGKDGIKARFSLNSPPDDKTPKIPDTSDASNHDTPLPVHIIPIVYPGDFERPPNTQIVDKLLSQMEAARSNIVAHFLAFWDPSIASIVLHETAEVGLLENVIRSKDRRWLCDGTANYAAWKAVEEVYGPQQAKLVYDLDADLHRYASQQKQIRLRKWPTSERQKDEERGTDLNRAHYAFAARAIFLIAERHGEEAIPLLWQDVSKTDLKRASAKTFAKALTERYNDNLTKLIRVAEKSKIPVKSDSE